MKAKCPECGKVLDEDECLLIIRDNKTDEVIGVNHIKKKTLNDFRVACALNNVDLSDAYTQMMIDFLVAHNKYPIEDDAAASPKGK